MNWIKRFFGKGGNSNQAGSEPVANEVNSKMAEIHQAGSADGRHYTDSVETVKELKREGRHQEAIAILLESVNSTETESDFAGEGLGVAPWYYEQLAIIYRKERQYQNEVEILERYASQPKAPGAGPQKLAERLKKAKELLAKHSV